MCNLWEAIQNGRFDSIRVSKEELLEKHAEIVKNKPAPKGPEERLMSMGCSNIILLMLLAVLVFTL